MRRREALGFIKTHLVFTRALFCICAATGYALSHYLDSNVHGWVAAVTGIGLILGYNHVRKLNQKQKKDE